MFFKSLHENIIMDLDDKTRTLLKEQLPPGTRILSKEEQHHLLEHRCKTLTKPPYDSCYGACQGDIKNGTDTWLAFVQEDSREKSKCYTCPIMKELYPNLGKCHNLGTPVDEL